MKNIVSIALGLAQTILLDKSGKMFCAGVNSYGELGIPRSECHRRDNDDARMMPRFYPVPFNAPVLSVACGLRHMLVLSVEGYLFVTARCLSNC